MIDRPSYMHGMEAFRAFGDHRDQAEPHRQYCDVLCSDHPLELPWEWLTRHGVESWCLRLNLKRQEEPHGDDAAFRGMMVWITFTDHGEQLDRRLLSYDKWECFMLRLLEAHDGISGTNRPSDVHDAQSSSRGAEDAPI
ncbi:hypothetical protein V500_04367 [Pseudogymnoascus sp. VKM F-4518 (FW-2643)]|nr:hypothetical protein V500_04367 [Pseudogymnoascus sp. VKM F-4518 (FW-2643)]